MIVIRVFIWNLLLFRLLFSLGTSEIDIWFINSVTEIFPLASFNFAGGASMVLKPVNYLVHMGFVVSSLIPFLTQIYSPQGFSIDMIMFIVKMFMLATMLIFV